MKMPLIKEAIPTGKCYCGCGESVKSGKFFVKYHHSKAWSCLIKLHQVKIDNSGIANLLLTFGYDDENSVCAAAAKISK